ncbi:MAG: glycoside hydrolase family 13 protein [Bacteroidota bacterium]
MKNIEEQNHMNMSVQTPEWVKHAIFYQIFPDRFRRSKTWQQPAGIKLKDWGAPPEEQGFQGGDLYGIIDALDYLQALGVTALYLNPIFASAANHRYHTFDYYQVDPLLGGNEALRALLDAAHTRDMKVVLDGVFNHASRGFWPFHHILENGSASPYIDWFIVEDWPMRPYPEDGDTKINYAAWWDLPALPKLNTANPDVQQYILDIAKYWIDFGIDGWRLDVPAEIDDDAFWRRFRDTVKTANPEAYICGEIWEEARRWLQGDQFDAVMNYTVSWAAMTFCGFDALRPGYERNHLSLKPRDAAEVATVIDTMYGWYNWEINFAQLNLLDSHDTARALWVLSEKKDALKLCVAMLMTLPGAPCIYYGDEIGMSAGDDPYCREAFPWEQKSDWDLDLLKFYSEFCALRNNHKVLRTGDFKTLYAAGRQWVFRRKLANQAAFVGFNTADAEAIFQFYTDMVLGADMKVLWPAEGCRIVNHAASQITVRVQARTPFLIMG